ncbi:5907_t:CDS:2 [Acaulospora colombiana]|uniref:5907_t:CDS:1 n=1 Tax=Acaulospora colombiana TaxID=27376 RepID=A0ACA9MC11_9GLOM|nr:5907_t:CDS:2 [Acaulospora colombiana]
MPQGNIKEQSSAYDTKTTSIMDVDPPVAGETPSTLGQPANDSKSESSGVEWDVKMEIEFFRAIMKHRPVGIHRHFHMVNVHRDFNANSAVKCTIPELWERFGTYFNLSKLEELDREFNEEVDEDSAYVEFNLPMDEYYNLMIENSRAGSSRGPSPSPAPSRHQKGRKEPSPSLSRSSPDSSLDPEDSKKTRRTRTARKSDTTEPTKTKRTGTSRSRKTSDAVATSSGTSKRGGRKKKQ